MRQPRRAAIVDLSLRGLAELLESCIHAADKAAGAMRVDLGTPTDRFSLLLLHAILAYGRAILALITAGEYSGIPIVCRSAVEASVDIANLCDHADYWEFLEVADVEEWQKFLVAASEGKNPVLAPLAKDPAFSTGRRHYAQLAQKYGQKKLRRLSVKQRFLRAGMSNEYESIYALLCAEAHSNVANSQSRYLDASGQRLVIRRREIEYADQHHYEGPCTLHMSEIVLRATEKLLRHCGHGTASIAAELARLEEFDDALGKENKKRQRKRPTKPGPSRRQIH